MFHSDTTSGENGFSFDFDDLPSLCEVEDDFFLKSRIKIRAGIDR